MSKFIFQTDERLSIYGICSGHIYAERIKGIDFIRAYHLYFVENPRRGMNMWNAQYVSI